LFNVFLNFLARAIRQEKKTKEIKIRNDPVMLSLFADENVHVILFLKNTKVSNIKPVDVINTFVKGAGYKITI
jgi:hypothetical protein